MTRANMAHLIELFRARSPVLCFPFQVAPRHPLSCDTESGDQQDTKNNRMDQFCPP